MSGKVGKNRVNLNVGTSETPVEVSVAKHKGIGGFFRRVLNLAKKTTVDGKSVVINIDSLFKQMIKKKIGLPERDPDHKKIMNNLKKAYNKEKKWDSETIKRLYDSISLPARTLRYPSSSTCYTGKVIHGKPTPDSTFFVTCATGNGGNTSGWYKGELDEHGRPHGQGVFRYHGSDFKINSWEGKFENGDFKTGKYEEFRDPGKIVTERGGKVGFGGMGFPNSTRQTRGSLFGEMTLLSTYEGDFNELIKEGKGTLILNHSGYTTEAKYQGTWSSGMKNGEFKIYNNKDELLYEGPMFNDFKHGKAKEKNENGEMVEVTYNLGKREL